MNRRRTTALVAAAAAAGLVLAGCSSSGPSSSQNDQQTSDQQLKIYQRNQPVPRGNYSEIRQTMIEVEQAEIAGTATTTFFYNQGSPVPIKSCPSIGYPVPATTQITNPQQMVGTGGNYNAVTLPQSDPNGIFSGDTSGTFVVCVEPNGTKRVDYWEGFVETEGGQATADASGHIADSGQSTVVQGGTHK